MVLNMLSFIVGARRSHSVPWANSAPVGVKRQQLIDLLRSLVVAISCFRCLNELERSDDRLT